MLSKIAKRLFAVSSPSEPKASKRRNFLSKTPESTSTTIVHDMKLFAQCSVKLQGNSSSKDLGTMVPIQLPSLLLLFSYIQASNGFPDTLVGPDKCKIENGENVVSEKAAEAPDSA